MFYVFYCSQVTSTLFALIALVLFLVSFDNRRKNKLVNSYALLEPPSPRSLPIIGHLHLLGGYEVPYQAFTDLGKKYGNIIKLQLGNVKCVVINGHEYIREVLVTKGHYFDSRPNFERYQQLFGGNKENSLAFCDWSETQRIRREMLRAFTFPRVFTNKFRSLEDIVLQETSTLTSMLTSEPLKIKPLILQTCANVFTQHFCSKGFNWGDVEFVKMIENFDDIFYEVNQGYAADFLPFLLPLHRNRITSMNELTHKIRNFILQKIIENRFENFDSEDPADYLESLIQHVKNEETKAISWEVALFALEDVIGGHSAVGNFVVKLLGFLVNEPEVQKNIQEEIDGITLEGCRHRRVCISDRVSMPYTEGTIFEAIRLIASPIVPRVANQETSIEGYSIKKDTLVFLNNYDLSMSEKLWEEPEKFKPERFILDNHIVKPAHFLPFGGGRRSCMGYKMVQLVSFGILTEILQNYTILPVESETYKVPIGSLALPRDTFSFRFLKR